MNPFCFGLPSVISFDSPVCKGCQVHHDCARASKALLLGVASSIDVAGELARFDGVLWESKSVDALKILELQIEPPVVSSGADVIQARKVTEAEHAFVDTLPVKARQKMRTLIKKGLDKTAKADFLKGLNPFPLDSQRYLHVACQYLLVNGPTTKREMCVELEKQMGWTRGTAASHLASICVLFDVLGISKSSTAMIVPTKNESDS